MVAAFMGILLLSCCSDEPTEVPIDRIREVIELMQREGILIDNVDETAGKAIFDFSDGSRLGILFDAVSVVSIDPKGFWSLNGTQTDDNVENSDGFGIIDRSKSDSGLCGIVEDYTQWSFVFDDGECISIKKSLFGKNADDLIKGINHRGYSKFLPENTLPAFRMSRLKGFEYVETDIRFSSDGVPVLLHDETIDRTSSGNGKVSEMSLEQLRSFDFGSWKSADYQGTLIPTLDEFLKLCDAIGLKPYLELKVGTKAQIRQVVTMVESFGMGDKVTYISFSEGLLRYVSEIEPDARIGYLFSRTMTRQAVETAASLKNGVNSVFVDSYDYSSRCIDLCTSAGLPLEVWTINSEREIRSLPEYISGVTSDYLHAGRVVAESK